MLASVADVICHWVADADFAARDRQYMGYHNDANNAYRWIADGSR
jgi:hypothetical protein